MSYLVSTYSFSYGTILKARVRAHSPKGYGGYSPLNSAGSTIQGAPTFMNAPIEQSATATSLVVSWAAITSNAQTGASAITSYELDWDQGTGTYIDLKGLSTPDTTLSWPVTGLTAGTAYTFKVKAYNAFGPGPFSTVVILTPSAVPTTMVAVTTAVVGTNVKISWAAPASNGAAITAYKIFIGQTGLSTFTESTSYCDGSSTPVST